MKHLESILWIATIGAITAAIVVSVTVLSEADLGKIYTVAGSTSQSHTELTTAPASFPNQVPGGGYDPAPTVLIDSTNDTLYYGPYYDQLPASHSGATITARWIKVSPHRVGPRAGAVIAEFCVNDAYEIIVGPQ